MKLSSTLAIAALSFVTATAIHSAYRWGQSNIRTEFTDTICASVANYLETGSLRPAFEVMTLSTSRMYPGSCVTISDQDRVFSPQCRDEKKFYQITSCTSQANSGVKAKVFYPVSNFFNEVFLLFAASLFVAVLIIVQFLRRVISVLQLQMDESVAQLFGAQSPKAENLIGKFLKVIGASDKIKSNTKRLEKSVMIYKEKLRGEAEFRALQSKITERNSDYISKAVLIRHDMAAPIGALIALKSKLEDDADASQMMNESIRRLKLMMDDLSSVTGETFFLRPESIQTLIAEVVAHLSPRMKRSYVTAKIVSTEDPMVAIDAEKMKRLLSNLVINAIEAKARTIQMRVHFSNDLVQIELEDNGKGVPIEIRHALFEKGTTFGKLNGSGLGLHYARQTLRAWHGDIELEHLSKGTRVRILLPSLKHETQNSILNRPTLTEL